MSRDAEATFLFADIAGFTALTEAHGDEQAVQLVEEFAEAVRGELPRVDGIHASCARRSATLLSLSVSFMDNG